VFKQGHSDTTSASRRRAVRVPRAPARHVALAPAPRTFPGSSHAFPRPSHAFPRSPRAFPTPASREHLALRAVVPPAQCPAVRWPSSGREHSEASPYHGEDSLRHMNRLQNPLRLLVRAPTATAASLCAATLAMAAAVTTPAHLSPRRFDHPSACHRTK
jgi:hypothetical protein